MLDKVWHIGGLSPVSSRVSREVSNIPFGLVSLLLEIL